jgi:hypothetical protein
LLRGCDGVDLHQLTIHPIQPSVVSGGEVLVELVSARASPQWIGGANSLVRA